MASRDWVDHQACNLLQYINVITKCFLMRNYFNELRSKFIRANNFVQIMTHVAKIVPYVVVTWA